MKRIRLAVRAGAVALMSLLGTGVAVSPAYAASPYWQPTSQTTRGSCTGTFMIEPGLYGQVCTRIYNQRTYDSVTFKNYFVVTSTGTAAHKIEVDGSGQRADTYIYNYLTGLPPALEFSDEKDTGFCYNTTIYSGQSLTCESSTASFSCRQYRFVKSWGVVGLGVDGEYWIVEMSPTISTTIGCA